MDHSPLESHRTYRTKSNCVRIMTPLSDTDKANLLKYYPHMEKVAFLGVGFFNLSDGYYTLDGECYSETGKREEHFDIVEQLCPEFG